MRAAIILAVLSLGFAPVPFVKPPRKPETLLGKWERVSSTLAGSPLKLGNPDGGPIWLRVEAGTMTIGQGPATYGTWDFTADDKARPARLVLKPRGGVSMFAVYKFEGDMLTIASSAEGHPVDFDGRVPNRYLSVYRRVPMMGR